eukprot:CAMPEP_0119335902 /NCGR_PEP_ID=MMETSP1333-20130426/90634_1 /TAXON_ID=418940 /ORGANISM="Scyphosphaera apsteinii, Strain RCC1455" /LENGTH=313 /DNA_ID=CAMNT_0007346575 /DNA_START=315 /DNA_END=1256 /DNA_ORIENTATION=-
MYNIIPEQGWAYLALARHARNEVVCETGFMRGVSSHLWLFAHNSSIVHSFDIRFIDKDVSRLRDIFGSERLRTYQGFARETLRQFHPEAPCDIVSIDASHERWDPYDELVALLKNARCGAIVVFDDTFDDRAVDKELDDYPGPRENKEVSSKFYNACTRSYWRAVREGLVRHANCESFGRNVSAWGNWPKGYCMGYVNSKTACQSSPNTHKHQPSVTAVQAVEDLRRWLVEQVKLDRRIVERVLATCDEQEILTVDDLKKLNAVGRLHTVFKEATAARIKMAFEEASLTDAYAIKSDLRITARLPDCSCKHQQ